MNNVFLSYHPAVAFAFLACAIVLCMVCLFVRNTWSATNAFKPAVGCSAVLVGGCRESAVFTLGVNGAFQHHAAAGWRKTGVLRYLPGVYVFRIVRWRDAGIGVSVVLIVFRLHDQRKFYGSLWRRCSRGVFHGVSSAAFGAAVS